MYAGRDKNNLFFAGVLPRKSISTNHFDELTDHFFIIPLSLSVNRAITTRR